MFILLKIYTIGLDGIFAKNLKSNIKKIPGRQIVKDLYLSDKIKRVLILGNCSDLSLEYLKKISQ